MPSKVSVAIPTYNRSTYLKECVQSIRAQTFQDYSVYVFDNASEEPIERMLKELGDRRIHFIGNDTNVGPTGNINRILRYPFDSEYLVVFHSDDAMHPKMLELEKAFLDDHRESVFVVSDLQHVSSTKIYQFQNLGKAQIPSILYKDQREFICAVMKWLRYAFDSAMYRITALRGSRMDFERFSDFADLAFLTEVSKKGPCGFLAASLVNYRVHPQQDSRDLKETYENGAIELLRLYREIAGTENRSTKQLFQRFAPNFLLRTYANINRGFPYFLRFIKKCRRENVLRYEDFLFLDERGIISLFSILVKNKKIIEAARWVKNSLRS